jgi:hypothetical protein
VVLWKASKRLENEEQTSENMMEEIAGGKKQMGRERERERKG